jgi:hypothetical protein
MKIKEFHLVTSDDFNKGNIEIDFSEYDIMSLIKICLLKRQNKKLGTKFAMILMKSTKNAKQALETIGLKAEHIEEEYMELKKLLGGLH